MQPSVSSCHFLRASVLFLAILWLPVESSAFFCNQPNVTIRWAKYSEFKIDGDDFSRGNFTVIDPGDESIISFDKLEIKDALEATFELTGLKPGSTQIQVAWEFTDNSDNGVCTADVTVEDFPVGIDAARKQFEDYIGGLKLDPEHCWAFMPWRPYCAGTQIQSADPEEFDLTFDHDFWFTYLDGSQDLRYAHYGKYLFIDAATGELTDVDVNWYPLINGEEYLQGADERFTTEDRIFGSVPEPTLVTDMETVSEEVSPTPKTEVCAVLVSGTASNPRQIESFETDVDFMRKNLMGEKLGPQLADANVEVMNNASHEEIREKLRSFQGQYSKVYFFYSGHGTERYMVTNDTVGNRMWYVDLARYLDETEANDVCVIIDACHSGGAVEVFRNSDGLRDQSVTLATSCRTDTTSWTRYIVTGGGDTVRTGEYTWAFVKCFGDPNAETDGEEGISIREAHEWARGQNPTLDVGGTLRGRMDPQLYMHRAVVPVARETVVPDAGLTVDRGEDPVLPEGTQLRVDFEFDSDDTTFSDPEIYYISPKVHWQIELVPDPGDYSMGLKFDYSFAEEDFTGQGEPGVAWRPSADLEWEVWRPSLPLPDEKFVWALEVDKIGQFAIAEVEPADVVESVEEEAARLGFTMSSPAPNPAVNHSTIRYALEQPGLIRVTIVDGLGRSVRSWASAWRDAAEHQLSWDGRDDNGLALPAGAYLCRVEFGTPAGEQVALTRGLSLVGE